ncbi:GYF domain-containing protein [Luteolibacter algae]|uniref:GYF domain-containing protein n=1 Tax=Luteolibacter algae TaxID=454151 RepID=A0ABW5D7S8_9BACT
MSTWFYAKEGKQLGPVTIEILKGKANSGEILSGDLVWKDGMSDWLRFDQVPELCNTGPPPLRADPAGNVPLPQPPAYSTAQYPQKVPTYFWMSIVAIGLGLFSFCFIGLPFAIVGMVYSTKVEPLRLTGQIPAAENASRLAKIWMLVSLAFSILPWLVMLVFFFFAEVFQR